MKTGAKGRKSAYDVDGTKASNVDIPTGAKGRKSATEVIDFTDNGEGYESDEKSKKKSNTILYIGGATVLGIIGIMAFKK